MTALVWAAYALFAARRGLTYLHIFQQEEYDGGRFLRWVFRRRALDRRASAVLLIIGILDSVLSLPKVVSPLGICAALLAIAAFERDPRRLAKKQLVMTARAKRTFWVAFVLLSGASAVTLRLPWPTLRWILCVQAIPFVLVLASFCLQPYEHRIQQRFWREAHAKLMSLKPMIIGLTGSYGKTSVKHILGHVIGAYAPTLSTPGSVNTPMGIARIVREQLGPHHRFFLCEMGAYGPGSIERLCRLAPPDLAIITAIGPAHYERFKSLEAVARTKFELAQYALDRGGKLVVTHDVLSCPYPRSFYQTHRDRIVVVGSDLCCELRVGAVDQTTQGISVEVVWAGTTYILRSRLYGSHHAMNLAMAFAAACVLGMAPVYAVVAIGSVPQVSHRLEVKRQPNGHVLIDDAYNSNPVGFVNGLQLLNYFRRGSGRRILVTPGMVELGTAHDEEHRKIGECTGRHVDVLLAVVPQRIDPLIRAYSQANPQGTVISCSAFADAQRWLEANVRSEDVVLLENDLPDLYEKKLSL